ncbi:alpha/beta fold hydrolase [Viridibacillus sp. YIM B01967]|uniref:Alpha/beta fold hydrolase n=1 Tax=Viridibacillus soli TaxID=2798301 RepID=A0ABS1H8L8_9BACL|nr:alpha/beta fold hydrolase [Viridibacillus soli]MBK3495763.1 alpha/beta fold hydrolase [Viridibacillus soli]
MANSLKMLAESLAKEGIASIRYDKRGVGENTALMIKEEDLLIEQYVEDVNKIIKYVKSEDKFRNIHIIGHSEGSLIGMLAAQNSKVASFTSLAGAGRPADVLLKEHLDSKLTPELKKESTEILASLKEGKPIANVSSELQILFRPSLQPYLMSWLKYDPAKSIQKVSAPVLIIQGARDIQVPVKDAQILKSHKEDAELMIVKKMNHILKDAPENFKGNIATYSDPTIPLSPKLVEAISGFIQK